MEMVKLGFEIVETAIYIYIAITVYRLLQEEKKKR